MITSSAQIPRFMSCGRAPALPSVDECACDEQAASGRQIYRMKYCVTDRNVHRGVAAELPVRADEEQRRLAGLPLSVYVTHLGSVTYALGHVGSIAVVTSSRELPSK